MIKAPRTGAVKTRLIPPLTPDEAAALNICFLQDTAANIAGVAAANDAQGIVVYTPIGEETAFNGLLPDGFTLLSQRGESFGDRLFHAAEDLFTAGYESLCLINSDSPTLPQALFVEAVTALARLGDRVVLGAADDGGYYLIGLKRAHRRLFTDIEWSTSRVLMQTIERAAEIGLEVQLLPAWYDVDNAESLAQLCDELFTLSNQLNERDGLVGYAAPYTRSYLSQLIKKKDRERLWLTQPILMEVAD
jgi:rSAM/selenodomain-associated transferase 1